MRKALHMVDPDTGEIVGTVNPGDRIVRKESVAAFTRKKAAERAKLERENVMKMKYEPGYLTVNTEERNMLLGENELDQGELAVLYGVESMAQRTTCEIRNPDGEVATLQDIADHCCISRQTAHNALTGLTEKHLLAKTKQGRRVTYYMNPWLSVKDMYVLKSLKDLFGEYEVRTHGKTKWKDLKD